jgi:hypothetical protein
MVAIKVASGAKTKVEVYKIDSDGSECFLGYALDLHQVGECALDAIFPTELKIINLCEERTRCWQMLDSIGISGAGESDFLSATYDSVSVRITEINLEMTNIRKGL